MKKLLKNDFVISLVVMVLIVVSSASMFAPVATVGNDYISFYQALHYELNDAIPVCKGIVSLIVFSSLSLLVVIAIVVFNKLSEEQIIKAFKKKNVFYIVKFILLIALSIFLFVAIFLAFFGYNEFVSTIGTSGIIKNWSKREYGFGCILVGVSNVLAFLLSAFNAYIARPTTDLLYGE